MRRTLVCVGVMARESLDCVHGVLMRELLVEEDIGRSAREMLDGSEAVDM